MFPGRTAENKRLVLLVLTTFFLESLSCLPSSAQFPRDMGGSNGDEFHSSGPGYVDEPKEYCDERLPSGSHSGPPKYIPVQDMGKRVSGINEPPVYLHQLYDCGSSCRPGYVICWEKPNAPKYYGGTKEDVFNSNGNPPDSPYNKYKPVPVDPYGQPLPPRRRRGPINGGTSQNNRKKPGYKVGAVYVPTKFTIYKTRSIHGKPYQVPEETVKNIKVDIRIPDQNGDAYKDGNPVDGPVKTTKDNPVYTYGWGTVHRGPNGNDSFTVTQLRHINGQIRSLKLSTPLRTPQ